MIDATTLRQTDYGFFGPDSPSWKVWTAPTALIGFQRSVVLEHFDPHLAASVADMNGIYADPQGRLDRTLAYFLTIAVGDSRNATRLSEHLMQVHAKSTGIDPITGRRYSPNNPESQLWIHVTGWHSVLKAYEMFGPGPLSEEEENKYWAECVVAAELQTCDPADVPRSRAEVHTYFEKVRPRLCSSERAQRAMHYLLRTNGANGSTAGVLYWAASRLAAPATIASLPKWMREVGGFDQPRFVDVAVRPAMQVFTKILTIPVIQDALLPQLSPMTSQILHAHRIAEGTGLRPDQEAVMTPSAARELYGRRTIAAGSVS